MSTNVIIGKDVAIDIFKVDDYYPFVCAENCSLDITTTIKSVKTIGDGIWGAYRAQKLDWGGSADGLIDLDDSVNANIFDVVARQFNMLHMLLRFVFPRPDGSVYKAVYGQGIILNTSLTGPNDFAGGSWTIQGSGPLEIFDGLTSCDSAIVSLNLDSQTTDSITVGYTGATLAVRFDYRIWNTSGFTDISIFSGAALAPTLPAGSFTVSPILPNGAQRIDVTPVCANGENGTTISLSYTKT